jgi:hypothetical protein
MSGVPEPQYVVARSVLLDALDALGAQREALILVFLQQVHVAGLGEGDAGDKLRSLLISPRA